MDQYSIVVDIDNTLWDFATALRESCHRRGYDLPEVSRWTQWKVYELFGIPANEFYSAVREVHEVWQLTAEPYPGARELLIGLRDMGFRIVIASNRSVNLQEATIAWLVRNRLIFDDIHLSKDKTKMLQERLFQTSLFDSPSKIWGIIDDSPKVLQTALDMGLFVSGLRFPWNSEFHQHLSDSLHEILERIQEAYVCDIELKA